MGFQPFFIIVILVIAAGCALPERKETMSYPEKWPHITQNNVNCLGVNGEYEAIGENAEYSSNSVNSPYLLGLFRLIHSRESKTVVINYDKNISKLILVGLNESGESIPSLTATLTVSCIDGSIFYYDSTSGYGDGTYSESKSIFTLAIAEDKSLIVGIKGNVESKDLLFRWSNDYDVLYRFMRI